MVLTVYVAKLKNPVLGCHRSYRDTNFYQKTELFAFFTVNSIGHGKTVGVAKLENQVHGCHGLTVTLLFLPKNSLNIAVLIQILFGHGKTMTAMNIYPQL